MDTYTIAPGDTLSGISASKGIGMNDLLAANPHITDPNKIYAGATLNLPRASAPSAAGQPPQIAPGTGAAYTPSPDSAPAPTPDANAPAADPNQAARESAAQDLGYPTFDAFMQDVTAKPSQSTQDFYTSAYNSAGLPDLLTQIAAKKDALNSALGTVNDNPWYDEAFRKGEAGRLQTLATGDINNLQADYNARLANVHDLVTRETADQATNDKVNATKLNYMQQAVQDSLASQKAADTVSVATQKADAAPPKTITSPSTSNVYQYNPSTKSFDLVQKGVPKPATSKAATTGASGTTGNVATVTDSSGTPASVPVIVAPYYNTSASGVGYADLSAVQGTAAQKTAIVNAAQAAGLKVILNKNTAADLQNIKDANNKLDTISTIMAGIDQPDALSRDLYGMGLTWLASTAQSDPQKAAAGALSSVGLDILKAISGIQGFRGNASVVQQVTSHLPSIYDTQAVVQQKVAYIRQLISDRENGIVGAPKTASGGGIKVSGLVATMPDGGTLTFKDQASLNAFRKDNGL
jgi:hypothetical protein